MKSGDSIVRRLVLSRLRMHVSRVRFAATAVLIVAGLGQTTDAQTSYLDNGTIRIGIDLSRGGAISYLSRSGTTDNVVNVYDLGRHIQQSYYSGPQPFVPPGATQHPAYSGWGWNPVQAGDVYGYRSGVLQWSNDGITLYVKCVPKQWALNNVDSECTMETWITLDQNRVHVHNRLTNSRSDATQYSARSQELPAVYVVGTLYNLYTYTGPLPFAAKPLTRIANSGPPWQSWNATEHWAALVNDVNWGLGVYHAGATSMIGGFHGTPGTGGPYNNNTGYIAPVRQEILDHDIAYEYDYTLILGTLEEIRAYVYAHRPDLRPNHLFSQSRQHWYYVGAQDDGLAHLSFLRVDLSQADPQMLGPVGFWSAAEAKRLYIQAAFRTQRTMAEVRFATPDQYFSDAQRLAVEIVPDGQVRTYELDLGSHPLYAGQITGLRFDPVDAGSPGDSVDLYSITSDAGAGQHADNVIAGVGVRASSELNCCGAGDRRAIFAVNGGGLGAPAGLRLSAHTDVPSRGMWLSRGTYASPNDLNPEITFDLHARHRIESIRIWNNNEAGLTARGIRNLKILVSDDNATYTVLPGTYTFARSAGGTATDISQTIDLPPDTLARYVKFDVETADGVSNHGGDFSFVGLSEVRLQGVPVDIETTPLPATIHSVSSNLSGFDRRAPYVLDGHDLFADTHGTNPEGTMWLSQGSFAGAAPDNDPEITFDMGSVVSLKEMRVWNYNEAGFTGRGIKTADILVAGSDGVFSLLIVNQSFDRAPGSGATPFGQTISLLGTAARYVKLDVLGNWGDADPAFAGLSKIQFFATRPPCNTPPQDTDGDADVDLSDFSTFQACFNSPNRPWSASAPNQQACRCLDAEPDGDIDLTDFARFQACFNGPNRAPACAN